MKSRRSQASPANPSFHIPRRGGAGYAALGDDWSESGLGLHIVY